MGEIFIKNKIFKILKILRNIRVGYFKKILFKNNI